MGHFMDRRHAPSLKRGCQIFLRPICSLVKKYFQNALISKNVYLLFENHQNVLKICSYFENIKIEKKYPNGFWFLKYANFRITSIKICYLAALVWSARLREILPLQILGHVAGPFMPRVQSSSATPMYFTQISQVLARSSILAGTGVIVLYFLVTLNNS